MRPARSLCTFAPWAINIYPGPSGESVGSNITIPGQNAYATFSGSEGQQVHTISDWNDAVTYTLSAPDGSTLWADTAAWYNGFVDSLNKGTPAGPIILPSAGTYTIFINPPNTYTHSFNLQVYDLNS